MQGVVQIYMDLKQKGIEFPSSDAETMAPIHTPSRVIFSFFIYVYKIKLYLEIRAELVQITKAGHTLRWHVQHVQF